MRKYRQPTSTVIQLTPNEIEQANNIWKIYEECVVIPKRVNHDTEQCFFSLLSMLSTRWRKKKKNLWEFTINSLDAFPMRICLIWYFKHENSFFTGKFIERNFFKNKASFKYAIWIWFCYRFLSMKFIVVLIDAIAKPERSQFIKDDLGIFPLDQPILF